MLDVDHPEIAFCYYWHPDYKMFPAFGKNTIPFKCKLITGLYIGELALPKHLVNGAVLQ